MIPGLLTLPWTTKLRDSTTVSSASPSLTADIKRSSWSPWTISAREISDDLNNAFTAWAAVLFRTPKTSSATHSNCEKVDNKVLTLLAHLSLLGSNSFSAAVLSEVLDDKLSANRFATSGDMSSILQMARSVRVWLLSRIRRRSFISSLLKKCNAERLNLVSCTDATSPSSMAPSCTYRKSLNQGLRLQSNFRTFGTEIQEQATLPKSSAAPLSSRRLSKSSHPSYEDSHSHSSLKIVTISLKNTVPSVPKMPAKKTNTWL